MTNFEKLTQSEGTLGRFIGNIIHCGDCPNIENCKQFAHVSMGEEEALCIPVITEWLRQEAEEK